MFRATLPPAPRLEFRRLLAIQKSLWRSPYSGLVGSLVRAGPTRASASPWSAGCATSFRRSFVGIVVPQSDRIPTQVIVSCTARVEVTYSRNVLTKKSHRKDVDAVQNTGRISAEIVALTTKKLTPIIAQNIHQETTYQPDSAV